MQDFGYRNQMLKRETDELLEIVTNKRDEYQENALKDAENILTERGIAFTIPEPSTDNPEEESKLESVYAPIVVGILMVAFAFYRPTHMATADIANSANLIVNVIIRLVVCLMLLHYSYAFKLKRIGLWIVMGLIFGGWVLIVLNIIIWGKDNIPTPFPRHNGETAEEELIH